MVAGDVLTGAKFSFQPWRAQRKPPLSPETKKAKPQRESGGPVLPESQGGPECSFRPELGLGESTRRP